MSIKILLLILPSLVCARINICIRASRSIQNSSVQTFGSNVEIINDKERETFRITDGALRVGAEKLSGGRPSHAFVKSPTPWNDLYQMYSWEQVKRSLIPIDAEILSLTRRPVTIFSQEFVNNSTANVKFTGKLTQYVDDIISNNWTKSDELYDAEKITYSIDLPLGSEGSTRIVYTSPWGEESIQTKNVTIGTISGVELEILPGKTVLATLNANMVTMLVQVQYSAILKGDVACNYPRRYKGHHFWAYDINDVLSANGLPKTVDSKEVLTIVFYTDARVTFTDMMTNEKVVDAPVFISTR